MRRAAAGFLVLGAMLVAPSAAAGGGSDPSLMVDPSSGLPGDSFTVSGNECFFDDILPPTTPPTNNLNFAVKPAGLQNGPEVAVNVDFPTPLSTSTNADDGGLWSVDFTVPEGTPPGPYPVTAECLNTPNGQVEDVSAADFTYPGGTYTVLAAPVTPPAPGGVAPGGAVTPPAAPVGGAPAFTG